MSLFEIVMLICFGSAWPFSIYKSYTSKSNKGKSVVFLSVVFTGYMMGMLHKYFYHMDQVIFLYGFNSIMVMADIIIFYRNIKISRNMDQLILN